MSPELARIHRARLAWLEARKHPLLPAVVRDTVDELMDWALELERRVGHLEVKNG